MDIYKKSSEYYDLIYQSVYYEKESDMLENIFMKFCGKKARSIIDIGCGTGSHSLLLSKRGYSVTGIDISKKMIEIARGKAEIEKAEIEFLVQDMRNIRLNKKFDCAICMFGAFGYILTYEDLVDVFLGLKRHLDNEGLFVFEFWNVGGLRPYLPYKSWMKIKNENLTLYRLSESNFELETNILEIDYNFILIRGNSAETFDETHRIRCYTLPEMQHYLNNNGFELIYAYDWEAEGKIELKELRKNTFRILAVSKNF